MNYGAIGWVIGHEITHGFDDQGRQFDKEGNLVNWWHPDTSSRYLNKAKCIIQQYSNYSFPQLDNLPLNGVNTQVGGEQGDQDDWYLVRERILLIMEGSRRPTELTVSLPTASQSGELITLCRFLGHQTW